MLQSFQPPTGGKRSLRALLEGEPKSRSQTNSFGVSPIVEQRLANFKAFQEFTAIHFHGSGNVVAFERVDEFGPVGPQSATDGEADSFAVRRNQFFAKRCPETMQRLSKSVSCVCFGDLAPEKVNELFTSSLSPDGEVGKERQRLTRPKPDDGCTVLGRHGWKSHQAKSEPS
jgi:hypothetical protein